MAPVAGGEGGADVLPADVLPAGVKGAKKRKAAVKAAEEEVKKKRAAVDRQVKKKVASKKLALEKEAVIYFQRRFEGPLGKGLRLFHPEPAKGGNSNTGEILSSVFMFFSVFANYFVSNRSLCRGDG